jgi:hypothetical protein
MVSLIEVQRQSEYLLLHVKSLSQTDSSLLQLSLMRSEISIHRTRSAMLLNYAVLPQEADEVI